MLFSIYDVCCTCFFPFYCTTPVDKLDVAFLLLYFYVCCYSSPTNEQGGDCGVYTGRSYIIAHTLSPRSLETALVFYSSTCLYTRKMIRVVSLLYLWVQKGVGFYGVFLTMCCVEKGGGGVSKNLFFPRFGRWS